MSNVAILHGTLHAFKFSAESFRYVRDLLLESLVTLSLAASRFIKEKL